MDRWDYRVLVFLKATCGAERPLLRSDAIPSTIKRLEYMSARGLLNSDEIALGYSWWASVRRHTRRYGISEKGWRELHGLNERPGLDRRVDQHVRIAVIQGMPRDEAVAWGVPAEFADRLYASFARRQSRSMTQHADCNGLGCAGCDFAGWVGWVHCSPYPPEWERMGAEEIADRVGRLHPRMKGQSPSFDVNHREVY